jgi:hypothetical protein
MARASSSGPVVCSLAHPVSRGPSKIGRSKMCNRCSKDVVDLKFKALARHRSQFTHIEERMVPRFCRGVPILPWVASRLF